jgi:group I intron endonuclease
MAIIYKITNSVNGKVYIGVTESYQIRKNGHLRAALIEEKPLYRAMRKYGLDKFLFEILHENVERDLEIKIIAQYQANNPKYGYNLTEGGEGTVGYRHTDETKEIFRQKKLGRKLSVEHRRKISESNKGHEVSSVTRRKIAEKLKGNQHFAGKTFSSETKQILSAQKAKEWTFRDPNGEVVTITNMRAFCLANDLATSAMSRVLSGSQSHHKGYTKL